MALGKQLKEDMANSGSYPDQNSAAAIPNHPNIQPPNQGTQTEEDKLAHKAAFASEPIVQEESQNITAMSLKSIEKQLISLSQSVANLQQEVSAFKNPDFRDVFSKIDSARCSIERMLSNAGSTSKSSSESDLTIKIAKLEELITAVAEKQEKNDRQLSQTLRENANFQIQVRQGMQKDIDALKEQQSGEQFNPILKEIASIYVEYQSLLEDECNSDLSRKNLKALFEQLEDLLIDYDAEVTRSEIGNTRQTRSTKIIGKVPTADRDKHNTIAMSRKPGVVRGRTVLYPEFVDVFVYDSSIIPETTIDTTITDAEEKKDEPCAEEENMETGSGAVASDGNAMGQSSVTAE